MYVEDKVMLWIFMVISTILIVAAVFASIQEEAKPCESVPTTCESDIDAGLV